MIKSLIKDVNHSKGEVPSLESRERQNKIIESLAMRSIEQKTDIRSLKRLT
jgi:hypothetical protein